MVTKVYQLGESDTVSLKYNPRQKDLAVHVNDKIVKLVESPPGLGSLFMFSEADLFLVIPVQVDGMDDVILQVYFDRSEMYTSAELYINGKSAENELRTLPLSYASQYSLHMLLWGFYVVFFVLLMVVMVLTMLLGFLVLLCVIAVYLAYWSCYANGRTFTYDVRSRVSPV